jgi:hypothetical protein
VRTLAVRPDPWSGPRHGSRHLNPFGIHSLGAWGLAFVFLSHLDPLGTLDLVILDLSPLLRAAVLDGGKNSHFPCLIDTWTKVWHTCALVVS